MALGLRIRQGSSIHAPRAGSDNNEEPLYKLAQISIHAPRAGSDICVYSITCNPRGFQSTLPVRGATKEEPA